MAKNKLKNTATTDIERGLFGKTFSVIMVKKHGYELRINETIKPLNKRITQYTVTDQSNEIYYNGESLSNACMKLTILLQDKYLDSKC